MKATTLLCVVLGVWICESYCSVEVPGDNVVEFAPSYYHPSSVTEDHHRSKRSPLDPIVAPLLIGKSFLYGALIGPKLFKPYYPRYHHYHYPIHHYPRLYGHYGHHGIGHYGHYGGYGYGK